MPVSLDPERFESDLRAWAKVHWSADCEVSAIAPMPGNAGLSFGFDLVHPDGVIEPLVIRLAPPGVRNRGNTDVLRQVPLLKALTAAGVPCAPLVWATGDTQWFGTAVLVQRKLAALPLHMTDPAGGVRPVDGRSQPYLDRAVDVLTTIHAVDTTPLASWDTMRTVVEECDQWLPLLSKAPPAWAATAERLRGELLATDPGNHRTGLYHGDYQTQNILFDDTGELVAVVDWEIAGLGVVGMDLGWLAMLVDESCWYDARRRLMLVSDDPARLHARYEETAHRSMPSIDWYEALACYRYGVIAAFNLHLHASGRRVDPVSELMGKGVPRLLERGVELCAAEAARAVGARVHDLA